MSPLNLLILIPFVLVNTALKSDTCRVSEFNHFDDLKLFLMDYQSQLKNSIDPIYDILHTISLNKQNLLDLPSMDLRRILKQNNLKKKHIDRLIKVLQNIQNSQINKEYKSTKNVTILSQEELTALHTIIHTTNSLEKHISNLNTMTQQLEQHYTNTVKLINERFNLLLNTINKRKTELLTKLDTLKTNKSKVLRRQMNKLKEYKKKFNNIHETSEKIINDKSISAKRRKRKIIRKTTKLFHDIDVNSIMKFKPKESEYIGVRLNMKNIIKVLQQFGVIENKKWEIVTMKTNVKRPQQTLFIFGTITNGYKHWIFQKGKALKVLDKMDGFITSCNPKSYNKGIHSFKIHVTGKMTGRNALGIVSGTMPTARMNWIGEHGYKHYYLDSKNGVIYKGNDKQVSKDAKLMKWKKNDVIVMTLNCNEWILVFDMESNRLPRRRPKKIKITKNKYYTCLTVEPKKGVKFEIVDSTW